MQFTEPRIVETSQGPVEYTESGQGPAVLALHGAMGGHDQGELLCRTLFAPGYRFIAVSRPGYLGTPLSAGRDFASQADLCALLLDALGIDRACAASVSGGGPCAINFALRHRDRCTALILASSCTTAMTVRPPLAFKIIMLLARWPAFGRFLGRRSGRNPEAAAARSIHDPELLRTTMEHPEAGPLFRALLTHNFHRMSERLAGTGNDIRLTQQTVYALHELSQPVLSIHGSADPLLPYSEHAGELKRRAPQTRLVRAEGGEHVAIFTHLDQVRSEVRDFMASLA